MKTQQHGFTLIELVMVLVILGIMSAVAVAGFVDVRTEAKQAMVDGLADQITTASELNFGARATSGSDSAQGASTAGLSCADAATAILQTFVTPEPVSITHANDEVLSSVDGTLNTCTVSVQADSTITASAFIRSVD